MTPDAENALLKAENAALREQVGALTARVQDLEGRLAKDSPTSGTPPASDGPIRKTRRLRRRSGKKPGGQRGQLGQRGETRPLVAADKAEAVVEQRPRIGVGCQAALDGDAPVVLRERRQVHELPPLQLVVRADQARHVRCPACQAVTVGAFAADAPSRAQYGPRLRALVAYLVEQQLVPYGGRVRTRLADLFGAHLSLGTLVAGGQQGAAAREPVEAQLQAALSRASVLHVL